MEEGASYDISIHALREEGDDLDGAAIFDRKTFLSTPSVRRATGAQSVVGIGFGISIHALREEGDDPLIIHCVYLDDFYPRPP